jgi:GT2 family glycosyltransferase
MSTLSVIIPTWNTSELTITNVTRLLGLKSPKIEIIVIDNASTDNTTILKNLKNIIYLRLSENQGYGAACNAGAKIAKNDYLLFLNSDMEIVKGLDKLVSFASTHPQVGITGPQFLNPNLTVQGSVFPPQTLLNAFFEFWLGKKSYSKFAPSGTNPTPVWAISGGAVLINKQLFSQIGGWDNRYHMYFEDLELCRCVRRLGLDITYFPDCQFIHRHGASGHTLATPQNQWRRLIKSSQIYHGRIYHYLLNLIIWSGQKISPSSNT